MCVFWFLLLKFLINYSLLVSFVVCVVDVLHKIIISTCCSVRATEGERVKISPLSLTEAVRFIPCGESFKVMHPCVNQWWSSEG